MVGIYNFLIFIYIINRVFTTLLSIKIKILYLRKKFPAGILKENMQLVSAISTSKTPFLIFGQKPIYLSISVKALK